MRSFFLLFMSTLIVGIIYLVIRNGVFLPVSFEVKDSPSVVLVGVSHVGPYHQVLPNLKKVEDWAQAQNLSCSTSFGEYLDDPNVVETARLRAFVGCVLDQEPDGTLPEGFEVSKRQERLFLIGTFKGSPALGPYKAYPDAFEYMARGNLKIDGPVIEKYIRGEGDSMTTEYWFPITKTIE